MCKTPVIHMFHTCNTDVYPTHVLMYTHIIHVKHIFYRRITNGHIVAITNIC